MNENPAFNPRQMLLAGLPENGKGVEIGVWKGEFSSRILRFASPARLHLVDPWIVAESDSHDTAWYGKKSVDQAAMDKIADGVREKFAAEIESGVVHIHRGKSVEVLAEFEPASLDFVYVDGDHAYDGVSADIEAAFRVVKRGGFIGCDDYAIGNWWKDGVVRAVHESLNAYPLVLELAIGNQVLMRKIRSASDR